MNKKEFSVYLHKPYLMDRHAEIALQEVIADFPYFHAAHQLLLKAHQNNGSYHFDRQLPITSLLHGNRALLYAYLKDSLARESQQVIEADSTPPEIDFFSDHAEAIEMEFSKNAMDAIENENAADVLISESTEEKFITLELPLEENQDPLPVWIEILEKQPEAEVLDLPFQNYEEKYLRNTTNPEGVKPPLQLEVVDSEDIMAPTEPPITEAEEKVISSIEPHDFLAWLQTKKTKTGHENKPLEESVTTLTAAEVIVEAIDETKTPSTKKISKFNDLIDKFIESSPSISKPQPSKFYNPAQKAKESVTENFDLATETLAKIYIKQNNYKKAILVYEKLSLLYPEKISYFAARISELQTLLNK